ncbi:AraC-type DNA-binding protein [Paenibacillus sp. UNCCL117]|uniref:AraC family transcriptional regulator n=1 Tax=unclassified Paenibacillus TaxID=185978 RepID=UPI000888AF8F|nr:MULTISPECIES: AraC family transcriptional regulator [unclassified Paenibacillus]SDD93068.1 AraC-type DNA-binding protein [Paenibacillus sp. cl123]SFW43313.1 AraC-type DNA-binding protein [Paenibacillus sp. UNCCL117]
MKDKRKAGCHFHFDNNFAQGQSTFGGIDLYQIGEICCESGYEIGPHLQFCLELSCIVSGSGYFIIDDEQVAVREGDLLFNATGHMHTIRTDAAGPLRFVYMGFMFNTSAEAEFAEMERFFQSSPYHHARDSYNLMMPFIRNIDEFYSQKPHSRILIRNYLEEIIVLAYRTFTEKGGPATRYAPAKSKSNSVGYTVYSVIRYVENHIFELKSIRTMAEQLGYSYTYLSHTFKDKTGMTLQRYINHKKVEKALELLRFGGMSITQVADRLQYETVQSFSKAFSRIMGCSPSHYVAQQREDKAQAE